MQCHLWLTFGIKRDSNFLCVTPEELKEKPCDCVNISGSLSEGGDLRCQRAHPWRSPWSATHGAGRGAAAPSPPDTLLRDMRIDTWMTAPRRSCYSNTARSCQGHKVLPTASFTGPTGRVSTQRLEKLSFFMLGKNKLKPNY